MTDRDCRFCHGRGVIAPRDGYLWQPCPMCGDLDNPHTSGPPKTAAHGAWDEPDKPEPLPWWKTVAVFGVMAFVAALIVGAVLLWATPW